MRHVLWLLLLCAPAVFAQPISDVTREEAQELFLRLKNDHNYMGRYSECFQRAHLQSHLLERESNVVTEKAFLFFTYKFQMRHRVTSPRGRAFTWWFHVAPVVRVENELWSLDATFTDRAMPAQQWARSLMRNPEECVETQDLSEYVEDRNSTEGYRYPERAREQCYMVNTPRFVYQPLDLGLFERDRRMQRQSPVQRTAWTSRTLTWALGAYSDANRRNQVRREMGL